MDQPRIEVVEVAVDRCAEPPRNPNRMAHVRYTALVEAIRKHGFLQPVLLRRLVERDGYEIVDGCHRLRAAAELGIGKVPAIVMAHDASADEVALVRVGMNRLRGDLDLAEVGAMFADLLAGGLGADDLATSGFTAEEVADLVEATQTASDDGLAGGAAGDPPANEDGGDKTFVLEVEFAALDDMRRARRALKKAAGRGGKLCDGLLRLVADLT